GPVSAPTIILATLSAGSNIGTNATSGRLSVSAGSMTISSQGSVWVTDTSTDGSGNVNLVNSTVDGTPYTNTAAGTFSFQATGVGTGKNVVTQPGVQISGTDVVLTSFGGFSLGDTVTGTSSVALISNDSITSIPTISTTTLTLVATGSGATIGTSSGSRL